MKERLQYLDILRDIACCSADTLRTAPAGGDGKPRPVVHIVHMLAQFGTVPRNIRCTAAAGQGPTGEFLRKRFVRVFPPLLFWSAQ